MTIVALKPAQCTRCGESKPSDGRVYCEECTRYDTGQRRVLRETAVGKCGRCGALGHNRRTCTSSLAASLSTRSDTQPRGSACDCGAKSSVMETREAVGGTRRRRLCTMCGRRWTTLEINTDNFAALVERGTEAAKLIAMFKNIVKEDE